jgi:hypothetical protein
MLVLKKRQPIRVELPGGVVITSSAIDALDIDLARQTVFRRLGMAADAAEALARYGIEASAFDAADEGTGLGLYGVPETLLAIELAIRKKPTWEGVGTDGGEAAPCEPGFISLLFKEWVPGALPGEALNYGAAWLRAMLKHSTLEPGAPKGSAASPGSSTVEAAPTAGSAAKPATPAPLDGAA